MCVADVRPLILRWKSRWEKYSVINFLPFRWDIAKFDPDNYYTVSD
jgi:hypothetical protein